MKKRTGLNICANLIGLVRPLTGFMLGAIAMGIAGHLCAAFITIFGGYALLGLLGISTPLSIQGLFIGVGIFALARGILRYGEQACNHYIAFKLLALIRDKVFQALRRLCPAKLEGRDKGDLISVITSDIELLEVFYAHTISPTVIAVLMSLVMVIFIGHYHPILGFLAAAAYIVIGGVVPIFTSKASKDYGLRFRNGSGELSAFVLDSLRGLAETIQYGNGEERLGQMNCQTEGLAEDEEKLKRISGRNSGLTQAILLLWDGAMLFTAAYLYRKGMVGFDGVVIPTVALMSSFGPVVALAGLGSTLQNTFAAGNRVLDILEEVPEVEEICGKENCTFSGADAQHIFFAYGEEQILSDISLDIPRHSVIGIVGRSGSGKSTLLKLFMRFWEVQEGCVRISGRGVSDINTSNLRNMESFVTQQTHLFHDSIEKNIRIAKLDASREEIEEACKKAAIHDFIMKLPKGYDTSVGELGSTLSGGERQRIGLARAFLHDAPFILLDEPTSNLDSLNEAVVLRSLGEEREGKTVVLVSHRQSTMRIADRTYSVEQGRMS